MATQLSLFPPDGLWAVSLPFSLQLLASVYVLRQFGIFFLINFFFLRAILNYFLHYSGTLMPRIKS